MYHISNFIKSQWLAIILIISFIIYSTLNTANIEKYKQEQKEFNNKINALELVADKNKKMIDSLKQIDGVYVEKIKVIKQKEYEQIHFIDSLPANQLQIYFTERYPE
jgi:hypothetical protein